VESSSRRIKVAYYYLRVFTSISMALGILSHFPLHDRAEREELHRGNLLIVMRSDSARALLRWFGGSDLYKY